jgi:hypothetical protein
MATSAKEIGGIVSTTPGRQFFDQHMAYLNTCDLDRLVGTQYSENAVLITPFDILDKPPPHIIPAGPALVDFFAKWLDYHGAMTVDSLYNFTERRYDLVSGAHHIADREVGARRGLVSGGGQDGSTLWICSQDRLMGPRSY